MQQHANGHGDGNLHHARKNGGRVLLEHGGDHQTEDSQHHRQRHEQNEQEQQSNTLVEHAAGDVADGLAVVAEADHERAEVVHRADEN